jgi:hypothetical protein
MPVQSPSLDNKLATLLYNSPANDSGSASASPGASGLKAIQDATNVEALVAAMRTKHAETVELQQKACNKLSLMTIDNADNRAKAGNAGAVRLSWRRCRGT